MKSNLQISIKGRCSESKNDLAKDIKEFLISRGYGEVNIVGEDKEYPYDGLLMDESIEICVK